MNAYQALGYQEAIAIFNQCTLVRIVDRKLESLPMNYLIFINNIPNITHFLDFCIMFADDIAEIDSIDDQIKNAKEKMIEFIQANYLNENFNISDQKRCDIHFDTDPKFAWIRDAMKAPDTTNASSSSHPSDQKSWYNEWNIILISIILILFFIVFA